MAMVVSVPAGPENAAATHMGFPRNLGGRAVFHPETREGNRVIKPKAHSGAPRGGNETGAKDG